MNNFSERTKILYAAIVPQIILISISILWIAIFPEDNVLKYYFFNLTHCIAGIVVGVVLAFLGYGFYIYSKKSGKFASTVELFETMLAPVFSKLNIVDFILLSLISAFCEETFFRGLLQVKTNILISSLAFGILHLPGKKYWIYAFWASASGGILGYLFIWSGSLLPAIIAHSVNNMIGLVLLKKLK